MSSDTNVWKRLFDLRAAIDKMIVDETRDAEKVADVLQTIVDGAAGVKVYLLRLFAQDDVVPAIGGTHTFAMSGIFPGGVCGLALPVEEKPVPTKATRFNFYEQAEDGTFADCFGSLGEEGDREWTESQVVQICFDHPEKLRKDGHGTFFRVKGGFVAITDFDDHSRLKVGVGRFLSEHVWSAEDQARFFTPQLAA